MDLMDRAAGCLLGGALGDSFGYPVEFMSLDVIKSRNGGSILSDPIPVRGMYRFSDDTQMTVLTAIGLVEGGGDRMGAVWKLYRRWAEFQSGREDHSSGDHWVFGYESMRGYRHPGRTCMSAIMANPFPCAIDAPFNDSKGCGGVMRTSPVPIWCYANGAGSADSARLAARIAASTHGHPLGYLTAGFLSSMIFHILDGKDLDASLSSARTDCIECFGGACLDEMLDLLDEAVRLSGSDLPDEAAMAKLGEGWVAEETLAMAVFSCLRHPDDIHAALACAVNITGDSDSVGAVAGNILGASLGAESVRSAFDCDVLEDSGMIEKVAGMLVAGHRRQRSRSRGGLSPPYPHSVCIPIFRRLQSVPAVLAYGEGVQAGVPAAHRTLHGRSRCGGYLTDSDGWPKMNPRGKTAVLARCPLVFQE